MGKINRHKIEPSKTFKFKKPESYKKGRYNYPDWNINPADKNTVEYNKMWGEKIYNLVSTGKTWIDSSIYSQIDTNRAYANGMHPMDKFKDWMFGGGETNTGDAASRFDSDSNDLGATEARGTKGRKAWVNIDFRPVSVVPKIKTGINEKIRSMYTEMSVDAIDSFSVRTQEQNKYKAYFYSKNKEWIDQQEAMAGIKRDAPEFIPENLNELELYAASGGFKVPYTISMEDLLKHTFNVSSWDKEIAERIHDDLFAQGYAIIRERYDRELKRVVVDYCDLKYSGIQLSNTKSYQDSEYAYTIRWVEISQIRQKLNLSHEDASALARSYSGEWGNPGLTNWEDYSYSYEEYGQTYYGYDFYKVPVLDYEWIDIDNEKHIEVSANNRTVNKKYTDEELQDNEKLKEYQIRYARKSSWLIGTEYTFGMGKVDYMPRNSTKKPRLSYRAIRLSTTPILSQIKPFVDDFQRAWLKAQHFMSLAVGDGFAVDIGSLKNISIGKDKSWDPMKILEYYRQSTVLFYKRTTNPLSGAARSIAPPIIPISNSTSNNIKVQLDLMDKAIVNIEKTSGINMVSTGATPDPNVAKYNMQAAMQGTNEIINSIARATAELQEDVSINIMYRIRTMCKYDKIVKKSYENVIGETRMVILLEADKSNVEYGINIKASDLAEEKAAIMGFIQVSIKPTGSDDQSKLSISEAIFIQDMVLQRQNLRRIGMILGFMLRQKEKQAEASKREFIQLQGQQNIQLEEAKKEAQRDKGEFELEKQREKFQFDYIIQYNGPYIPKAQKAVAGQQIAESNAAPEQIKV